MQFSVPQFTDVEDRIVAGLTIKQFGIVFGVGAFTFAIFAITNNIVATIIVGVVLGLPALIITFGRVNGRPMYTSFAPLANFLAGNKTYVFHKEAKTMPWDTANTEVVTEQAKSVVDPNTTRIKLQQLNYVLQQQAAEENILIERIKNSEIKKQTNK